MSLDRTDYQERALQRPEGIARDQLRFVVKMVLRVLQPGEVRMIVEDELQQQANREGN